MVAVMELSEDMADKTRKALAEAAPYVSTPVFVEVAQFFDRLSPPAPEVDEATVWARKVPMARAGGFSADTEWQSAAVCQVLSELIASKDAEIEKLTGERDRQYDDNVNRIAAEGSAIVRAEKAESELAALRAENERKPIIMKADRKVDARALRTLADYIESDTPLKPGNKISWSDCLEGIRRHYLQAAERNTAEPAKETTVSYDPNYKCPSCGVAIGMLHEPDCALMLSRTAESAKTHVWPATHDDACSEIKGTETTPGTNVGAVEVTQADRIAAADLIEAYWQGAGEKHDRMRGLAAIYRAGHTQGVWTSAFAHHRTEAEARGRREALEKAACVMDNLCFFTPIDELREMTKQEMSVRACREGAAAIRDLIGEKS